MRDFVVDLDPSAIIGSQSVPGELSRNQNVAISPFPWKI
jgi:hypothetical protein